MSGIVEEFVNGYCKNYDMARSAICEFVQDEHGLHFDRIDCDYGKCPHSGNCEMIKKVFEMEMEKQQRKDYRIYADNQRYQRRRQRDIL